MAKLILKVPTVGAKRGDEIEVRDAEVADALVRNGSARRKAPAKKSEKD